MGRVEPLRPVSVLPSKLSGLICRETVYQASEKCWVGSPFLKFLPLKTSCCLGGHSPIGFFKGKHCAWSTFYFPCSNRLTWDPGSCWELINICWCQVFNHFGNKNWWERKISQEPKWCLISDSFSGFGSACKQGGCVQRMPAHPSSYCSLTKPAATSLLWMNFRRFILFPDGTYWRYRKAAFAAQRGFQVLIWCGEVHGPGHKPTSCYLSSSTSLMHFNPSWLKAGPL